MKVIGEAVSKNVFHFTINKNDDIKQWLRESNSNWTEPKIVCEEGNKITYVVTRLNK